MAALWFIVITLSGISAFEVFQAQQNVIDGRMKELFLMIQESQTLEESKFIPFFSFYKQRGTYPSYMKGNFHGKVDQALLRNGLKFYDNNAFTTSYIMTILLEVFGHTGSYKPSEEQMLVGIDSFLDYQDKNRAYNNSILSFWPLKYNFVHRFWHANPANTLPYLDMMEIVPVEQVAYFCRLFGLKDIDEFIEYFHADRRENRQLLFLPPDQDTSIIHAAFGATLRGLKDKFPKAWSMWNGRNPKLFTVLEAFKQYSYRPFSDDEESNSIDPRIYFYLSEFLDEAKEKGNGVALITTWTQTLTQQSEQASKGATMVRGINNVCLGVTANAVLGITRALTSGLFKESLIDGDPLMRQIYLNSSTLLAYQLDRNLTNRPDLALVYYPTRVQFEWMVSRTVAELESAKRQRGPLTSLLQVVYKTLVPSARASITKRLLNTVQIDYNGHAYYEDFLGAADLSPFGHLSKTGEDRIFCTALAVNTFVNIWTYPIQSNEDNNYKSFADYDKYSNNVNNEDSHNKNNMAKRLAWDKSTPSSVIQTVHSASQWIIHNALSGRYKPYGAFFSSSYKWWRTLPYHYPGNRYQFLNGTGIDPWSSYPPDHLTSYMVRGYIPPDEYQMLLEKAGLFGLPVPRDFHGYNADHTKYMWYWDSEPFAYSVTLLALAKYKSLVEMKDSGN